MIEAYPPQRLQRLQARIADAWERGAETWAAGKVDTMPTAWAGKLLDRWRADRRTDATAANLQHLAHCAQIERAHRAGVPADASDSQLCQIAAEAARDMARRLGQRDTITRRTIEPAASPWVLDWTERVALLAAYAEAAHWLGALGLGDVLQSMRGRLAGILARLTCERWWRRVLRRVHALAVESTARALGLVHKRAGCYVSDTSLSRRQGQNRRNAGALESVEAVNEHGQRFTLADLAAKGPANREIRRHELMTRIAGFEAIAKDCSHGAAMMTTTCPSRMHAWRTRPGSSWATQANPSHDGTTPDQAQAHLSTCWARMRSDADRLGLGLYGFRIAEPNHDGTPHWHLLLFLQPGAGLLVPLLQRRRSSGRATWWHRDPVCMLERLGRSHFLAGHDATERGAGKHRVRVERIDWNRGTAAGYIAKYVAKNIDGYAIGTDLYGNEAMHASARVDAWASTWRVRQFQQVGGAPVGVWRELRRLHPDQQNESAGLALALDAVNLAATEAAAESEGVKRYTAAHAWATYTELQGGPRVRRRALRFKLLREQSGVCGRYGDVTPPRAVGVATVDTFTEHRPAFGIVRASSVTRQQLAEVESERADWIIVHKGTAAAAIPKPPGVRETAAGHTASPGVGPMGAGQPADAGPAMGFRAARSAAPWSPVNNCTAIDTAHALRLAGHLETAPGALFAPSVKRVAKRGRWANWKRTGAGGPQQERQTCPTSPPGTPRPSRPN